LTIYLRRSCEVEKPVTGTSKKNSATIKVLAWEVRAIRIAKLDRAVQEDPSTGTLADDPPSESHHRAWPPGEARLPLLQSATTASPGPTRERDES